MRNKFDLLTYQIKNIYPDDYGKKTRRKFPNRIVFHVSFSSPFRIDRDRNGSGILLYIRENIPSKLLTIENIIEVFFVEFT